MTLLLTFLGTGDYQPCRYRIADAPSAEETFFSTALAAHVLPDQVVSLETTEATGKHGPALAQCFQELHLPHESIRIPTGSSESELWEIFDALTRSIPHGCTLHLDITHGFRSLPLLGFLALSYLRVTRQVTIGGIHYGAWEARDRETNIAPAFDLTPFLVLLDWTAAADQFLDTGDASRIGRLLRETQQSLWRSKTTGDPGELPKLLATLGNSIEHAAADRILLRTSNLAESASSVALQLERIEQTNELERHTPAFLQLLTPVRKELTRHGNADLSTLRDLIGWLAERNRPDAALTLAAEWLVCWIMVKLGEPDTHSAEEARKPFEHCLNQIIREHSKADTAEEEPSDTTQALKQVCTEQELTLLAAVAGSIKAARNDLNHAGFRKDPLSPDKIAKRTRQIIEELSAFPTP